MHLKFTNLKLTNLDTLKETLPELQEDTTIYRIDWKNLVAVLESPVIRSIRLN